MVTVNFCAKLILIPPRWYEAPTVVDEDDPFWPLVVKSPPPSLGNGRRTDKVSSSYERKKDGRRRTGHKVQMAITK